MRILVTGGNGFIGGHVVDRIIDDDNEPIIFDRHHHDSDGDVPLNVERFLGDIRDPNAVVGAVGHAEAVIHLAGALGTQETIQQPSEAVMTNITGMLNVLDAVRMYDVPLVNIAVGNYWMENPYSISKNTAERLCRMYRTEHGTTIATIRAMNAYGPRQVACAPFGPSKVRKIVPSFVCRALSGMPIEIYGDGTQVMDMIYVSDLADTLVDAIGSNGDYECGSGIPTTVNEIAALVAGDDVEVAHLPMRPGEPEHSVVLADRNNFIFNNDLVPLDAGLVRTIAWFQDSEGLAWSKPIQVAP